MRFRNKIKICKGLSLNLSKSGISMSVGGRGASLTIGKNGIYHNYGIPGTGLYNRKKIGNLDSFGSNHIGTSYRDIPESGYIKFSMDFDENFNIVVFDEDGNILDDCPLLDFIKSTEEYEDGLESLQNSISEVVKTRNNSVIDIYKETERTIPQSEIVDKLDGLELKTYEKAVFSTPKPTFEEIRTKLEIEAKEKIATLAFWKIRKLQEEYIKSNIDTTYSQAVRNWNEEKLAFEKKEEETKLIIDKQNQVLFDEEQSKLKQYLTGDSNYITSQVNQIASDTCLPFSVSIDFEYNEIEETLFVDLDLPEIEEIPTDYFQILKSGKVSVKPKTQKQIFQDYATIVCGLAYYFSGIFFNISAKIKKIRISGYTQRLNTKTCFISDDYVYSVLFDRELFSEIDFTHTEPIKQLGMFPHLISIQSNYKLKSINPLAPLDLPLKHNRIVDADNH